MIPAQDNDPEAGQTPDGMFPSLTCLGHTLLWKLKNNHSLLKLWAVLRSVGLLYLWPSQRASQCENEYLLTSVVALFIW